jgi:hypothetical protein
MISRPCEHCYGVKRCSLVVDGEGRIAYLCRACARELEYRGPVVKATDVPEPT